MSESIRIRTTVGNDDVIGDNAQNNSTTDKNIKIQLTQNFDFLEILSLKISQEELYRRFCSDYGVIVGRVIVNNGFGVPNAKVSVFIPITEEDKLDEEIRDLYPFDVVTDRDSDGVRYNLLPNQKQNKCHVPIGTLPSKREVGDNDTRLEIYQKYYKYTTTTNESGDFMIFGVPVGSHVLHMDADISDIGILSQRPYDFISQGVPEKKFDSPTKFKGGNNIDNLVQVKTSNVGVNVIPFWGDLENCEIGITRLDIDLNYNLIPSAIFMGSIFGDSEKNSINKSCRPRKDVGRICETVTSRGSIEMIRKTIDGSIERFDVQGGRVIDENGAWSYQVPMNLDYMVTDEFGNLVPSEDSNNGVPTRARARFRIGMDQTGGEGRLRTRAKYLVPNNPDSFADSDYTFDEMTPDNHFRDLSWNKVYTVKNFISRFQTTGGGNNRNMIGIKDVDDCVGVKNPFPYNRMDNDFNPLFSILCLIITILTTIVSVINSVLIFAINLVIGLLNTIINVFSQVIFAIGKSICGLRFPIGVNAAANRKACREELCLDLGGTCSNTNCTKCNTSNTIPYIPCIALECEDQRFAPGCFGNAFGWDAANNNNPLDHWANDLHNGHDVNAGYPECVSLTLAQALNVFEFDFYNDWVNGTLYSFLLKYKNKNNGKEKFCEYDCNDFGGGVDGDDDGDPDNNCKKNWLVDTCTGTGVVSDERDLINDGLIKKVGNELYYASYTHTKDYKLYATDIVTLGAVLDCDWQGKPLVIDQLEPTSYKIPPLIGEYDDTTGQLITSGMYGGNNFFTPSLFFDVSCLGLFTNAQNCINIKRICEIGVGLDEDRQDEFTNLGCTPASTIGFFGGTGNGTPDSKINNCDIDNLFIRDIFIDLNDPSAGIDLSSSSVNDHALFNVSNNAYDNFRGFRDNVIKQPQGNSLYFYFGTEQGKSALDLTLTNFFTDCDFPEPNDFIISGNTSDVTTFGGSDGVIDITIIDGNSPFTYSWSGPNGFVANTEDISGLEVGNYTVIVTDNQGNIATATFTVNGPFPVICNVTFTPPSSNGATDGEILISGVGGGIGPYTATIFNSATTVTTGPQTLVGGSTIFTGLAAGIYEVTLIDDPSSTSPPCITTIEITEPTAVVLSVVSSGITCHGSGDGVINISASGGVPPYTLLTTGPNSYSSSTFNQIGLNNGTYTITLSDSIGQNTSTVLSLSQPSQIMANLTVNNITCDDSTDGQIIVAASNGNPPYEYNFEYPDSSSTGFMSGASISSLSGTGVYTITVRDSDGCEEEFTETLKKPNPIVVSLGSVTSYNGYGVSCNGGTDGEITVSVTGGNPVAPINDGGYTYQLYDSGGITLLQTSPIGSFTNLSADTYQVKVTDVNGCNSNAVFAVLTEPPLLTTTINKVNNVTYVELTAVPVGGVTPYTFEWVGTLTTTPITTNPYDWPFGFGETFTLTVTDANGCTATAMVSVP
jgi:hypothetical protein